MSPNWMTTGAQELTAALGGRWAGRYGVAACPVCQPERRRDQRALVLADGRAGLLANCKKSGCTFTDILAAAGLRAGGFTPPDPAEAARRQAIARAETARKADAAGRLWREAQPIEGTLAETYLRSRGITCQLPASLRFHQGLNHRSGGNWPCMVALVTKGADDTPLAIHRTFLARDGAGKAPVDPAKMMLGPCRGGAVRLAEPGEVLMVGEGVETCLAAMQATGRPAWAALSTSGLRTLDLPGCVRDVIVLADGDDAGEAAARDCALRWMPQGKRVRIARPPRGLDFNDVLLGRAPLNEEVAQ